MDSWLWIVLVVVVLVAVVATLVWRVRRRAGGVIAAPNDRGGRRGSGAKP